jgi:hypothetical protein
VVPEVAVTEVGSFCAVDTVWKFIPKIAGVPTLVTPLWSNPLISLITAWTL